MTRKLLFLGCNELQVGYLKALQSMGFHIVGTDINDSAPGRNWCDTFYCCGYDDADALLGIGRAEGFTSSDKVFTAASQFAHLGAAAFAERFCIDYPASEMIKIALDKTLFYRHFETLGVPIPETTLVRQESDLFSIINASPAGWFYLKSDFSKNPNYVYRIHTNDAFDANIQWNKDRYLRNHYVLQPEFKGVSLRLNLYGTRFNVFDFETSQKTQMYNDQLLGMGVLDQLRKISSSMGFNGWLTKYDIILGKADFVVLDIGIDPPSRMRANAKEIRVPFIEPYLRHYLFDEVGYPPELDSI